MDCSSSIELSDVTGTSFQVEITLKAPILYQLSESSNIDPANDETLLSQAMMGLLGPLSGWEVALDFTSPITNIESPMAEVANAINLTSCSTFIVATILHFLRAPKQ